MPVPQPDSAASIAQVFIESHYYIFKSICPSMLLHRLFVTRWPTLWLLYNNNNVPCPVCVCVSRDPTVGCRVTVTNQENHRNETETIVSDIRSFRTFVILLFFFRVPILSTLVRLALLRLSLLCVGTFHDTASGSSIVYSQTGKNQ